MQQNDNTKSRSTAVNGTVPPEPQHGRDARLLRSRSNGWISFKSTASQSVERRQRAPLNKGLVAEAVEAIIDAFECNCRDQAKRAERLLVSACTPDNRSGYKGFVNSVAVLWAMTAHATIAGAIDQAPADLILTAPVAGADVGVAAEAFDAQKGVAMVDDGILGAALTAVDFVGLPTPGPSSRNRRRSACVMR